jgi:hypothetical protein
MDFLTGNYDRATNMVDAMGLYTLRFSDRQPRWLHTSPEGMLLWPTWSSDGRLLAFDLQLLDPGEIFPRIGWIDLNCRASGECPIQFLDAPVGYGLSGPIFSPQGDWLAITGVDAPSGAGEIYLLPFDKDAQPSQLQNFTNTPEVNDGSAGWVAGNKLVWIRMEPGNDEYLFKGHFIRQLDPRKNIFGHWHHPVWIFQPGKLLLAYCLHPPQRPRGKPDLAARPERYQPHAGCVGLV